MTNKTIHRLVLPRSLAMMESRADGDKPAMLEGYAAIYYVATDPATEYVVWDDMTERIMPGAFDAFIADASLDCVCSPDHDDRQLLGRRSSGRLSVTTDARGLKYSVPFDPDDPDHLRIAAKVKRRDVVGSSLRFIAHEERWLRDDTTGMVVREIVKADVVQLGPVTDPAYAGTTAEIRSNDGGWQTLLDKRAQFLAAEAAGADALVIEIDSFLTLDI
jgi:uncharacterized protein